MLLRTLCLSASMAMAVGILPAQTEFPVKKAQLEVPFGSATGYVLQINGDIVFVNEEKPEMSLHIPQSYILSSTVSDDTLIVVTKEPVLGLSEFRFRVDGDADAFVTAPLTREIIPPSTGNPAPEQSNIEEKSYRVRHKHFPRGGCDGHLIITGDRISFESLSDLDHSRQWNLTDIKEIKRNSPYELTVKPFGGGDMNFEVQGQGMSTEDYRALTEAVAAGRSRR